MLSAALRSRSASHSTRSAAKRSVAEISSMVAAAAAGPGRRRSVDRTSAMLVVHLEGEDLVGHVVDLGRADVLVDRQLDQVLPHVRGVGVGRPARLAVAVIPELHGLDAAGL